MGNNLSPIFLPFCLFFQMEESVGRVSAGDREYIIHPTFGQSVMQALRTAFPSSENKPAIVSSKKPFDWMSDEACSQLVVSFHKLITFTFLICQLRSRNCASIHFPKKWLRLYQNFQQYFCLIFNLGKAHF